LRIASRITLPLPLPSREGTIKPSPLAGEGRERGNFNTANMAYFAVQFTIDARERKESMSRTRHAIVIALISTLLLTVAAMAQEISVEKFPASVVKTVPQCGDTNVDPDSKEISIAFSKNMLDQAWSFVKLSEESFPKLIGSPKYLDDKRTCVVKIALEPEKTYALWLNTELFQNFKDSDNKPAVPYLLVFRTAKRK
jgi:hypothetical protein